MSSARPGIHLTADRGWVNDPLSPTWDGERYHLWFQYVPDRTTWAPTCHWGHAVSDDLLHWEEREVALAPGDGDGGVWSGSVVARPAGGHRAFYTSVDVDDQPLGRVRVADADTLDGPWGKGAVVVTAPEGLGVTSFRDPFVFADGDRWRMYVGAALSDAGEPGSAAALAFSSPDLDTWTFDGVAASRPTTETEPVWTGALWECPQRQRAGRADGAVGSDGAVEVLVTSVWDRDVLHHVAAATGVADGPRFEAAAWQRLTHGDSYYAPATFHDADGALCIVFWMRGLLDEQACRAGALSVPHRLDLVDGRLVVRLHPAVAAATSTERGDANALVLDPVDASALADGVSLGADGRVRLTLSHRDGILTVQHDDTAVTLATPAEGVQVFVDGPCVEVLTPGGAVGVVLDDLGRWDEVTGPSAVGAGWVGRPVSEAAPSVG
ncbi:glycoside hydrolase family 32 protein [Terracoccus luteus]|uniref:beta-fructofuranosidase n=1 Tax=Terracoccus luteus TaxID=53356 RepID=A0A839PY05_9MICO|nr:glycoside hydrolase family 32 protein [Terracoccus luteus]MBB2988279.1 beta-fructofuranosidase [Terracoccus luteus]MCP2173914.1 beta-fructofuranosidase [Terracoccus luteus]